MSYSIDSGIKDTEPKLTDHNYDGIQEYDNPMPGWWVWLFVATVVYSAVYWLYFESGTPGRSIYDEYGQQVEREMIKKFGELGELTPDRETLLTYMKDQQYLQVGKGTYNQHCAGCHGIDGGGGIGPNLTDDAWKSVRNIEDIATVIKNGAANGAMPAWGARFKHPNIIVLTSSYVASLRGTNPASPKAPEGAVINSWPAAQAVPKTSNADDAVQ